MLVIPAQEMQKEVAHWSLLASQCSLIGKFWASGSPSPIKQDAWNIRNDTQGRYQTDTCTTAKAGTSTNTHTSTSTHRVYLHTGLWCGCDELEWENSSPFLWNMVYCTQSTYNYILICHCCYMTMQVGNWEGGILLSCVGIYSEVTTGSTVWGRCSSVT